MANHLKKLSDEERGELFSYQPIHVIRRKDIVELFDTTPDLAGNDIDIARFIRDGRELDVQIFWREVAEGKTPSADEDNGKAPRREELCSVPCYRFRDSFLGQKKLAYRWDVLEKQWQRAVPDPRPPDDDIPSQDTWQTIADHSSEVVAEIAKIVASLDFAPEWREVLETSARWHDRGKAHAVFQEAIHDGPPGERERPDA